ncbi:hypothetical protein A3J36_02230 [Candidatus Uhrbacteria bacterium RIFCSPLOWO2_02_FULL_54_37]|uniref:Uncharacterized protein n=1 Tax=Candidatus Uhrbacteria bacterium RIFCSPLOWO2_02_FULL_54_37 TaxID=1802412 RepID=A0A1F7VK72_9BACT|nr:MAG: hypothetical protein A3J36_02230 [Candidatus Uhrbacteria bacterium RIFCSPLOWO2_02_FULL_54_37]
MLDKKIILPDPTQSKKETHKRMQILKKVIPKFVPATEAIMVSGSLAYGANYSVTEKSDIDLQLLVTRRGVTRLYTVGLFDLEKLRHFVKGYQKGIAQQFSLTAEVEGVPLECHFWDVNAFAKAATMRTRQTLRFRSSINPPPIDYAHSFAGEEDISKLSTAHKGKWLVSSFPSYRIRKKKMFFCRPITNIIGSPIFIHGNEWLVRRQNEAWDALIMRLNKECGEPLNLKMYTIVNILPGKNKISPAVKEKIMKRMRRTLA